MKRKYLLLLTLLLTISFTFGCSSSDTPKASFEKYINAWNKNDYKTMYSILSTDSKKSISQKDFVSRYENIYDGIELNKISVMPEYPSSYKKDSKGNVPIPFKVTMNTVAGKVTFNDTASFKESNNTWYLNWSSEMIHPDLKKGYKIRIEKTPAKRGEIKGTNGSYLAQNGYIENVGIVPNKFTGDTEASKKQIADILQVDVNSISKKLSASYVQPDMFISIAKLSTDDTDKMSNLLKIPGIMITKTPARVYPLKEKAAMLTGYVQNISADELKKLKTKGYSRDNVIGKAGLEKIYEKQLKATDGAEIYIDSNYDKKIKTIAKKAPKNGKDVNLTIDTNIQSSLYDEYKADSGASVALNPKTGAVLALVSAPSYNPNDFVLGMPSDKWNALQNDANKPLLNRFKTTFAPGSTFKPITAAIALDAEKLNIDEDKKISGLKWQENSSWGNYFVTRDEAYSEPANLVNALVHSDNIYFAKTALAIGKDAFLSETKKLGIGQNLPFEYGLETSKITSNGSIKDDIQLADSGYGQGEVLMNPVQLASIYTAFVNNGNIVAPYLNSDKGTQSKVLIKDAFKPDTINTIINDLTQVVSNPEGTGHGAYMPDLPLAGKTGTAEIKKSQTDTTGTENGWFIAVNPSNPKLLVLEMYENVKGKGGSGYVVPNVKSIFQQFGK
ncbi:Penicillin-binding protein 2 (serine-type D-Ala-D-Ala carboxypeptidase) [Clostridium acetobutylicum EA 2018]|uniref:penicillin-binding transpeptidase domain-containing protein n=1 Tax=Clostridium acetobutylicum TaxID=1488 RepID=UPI000200C330|nr:penicillin-binding transpeptidase domain-containing protein [Clostridium acetobutylicum]ADZ22727.1 Penicillin-binding protein 2 (serine-type D-Ala-D-Ala carboxypeptidase) [Clostridium acetobutylicum EA 2018]